MLLLGTPLSNCRVSQSCGSGYSATQETPQNCKPLALPVAAEILASRSLKPTGSAVTVTPRTDCHLRIRAWTSASKLLMPVAYVSLMGGNCATLDHFSSRKPCCNRVLALAGLPLRF